MNHLDIEEVKTVDVAVERLSGGDPCIGGVIALQLTGDTWPDSKEFREAAETMDGACCGSNSGVFMIDGDLWYVYCDFGH